MAFVLHFSYTDRGRERERERERQTDRHTHKHTHNLPLFLITFIKQIKEPSVLKDPTEGLTMTIMLT